MKILYAVQGTGNGHISRARDIIPILRRKGNVDVLISGIQADVDPGFPVTYRLRGLSFIFGKKGNVDILETYRKNKVRRFFEEVKALPVEDYDVVISDFEPVSSWACYLRHKPCVGLSHQAAVLDPASPKPAKKDLLGLAILKYYAPVTLQYGFHFKSFTQHIYPPVIRAAVRKMKVTDMGHYTVYLPAYDEERILRVLAAFPSVNWQVFSKHNKKPFTEGNISVSPVDNESFLKSLASGRGVLCGAGFETPAEALFLGKKLLVIPMKGQYEQQCNAAALDRLGVPVIKKFKLKHLEVIEEWLASDPLPRMDFPDMTRDVIEEVFVNYPSATSVHVGKKAPDTAKAFRKFTLGKILSQISG